MPRIRARIATEDRLDELVTVHDLTRETPAPDASHLIADERGLVPALDWYNTSPPYLLPQALPLDAPHLLGVVFGKLGNLEKTNEYLAHHPALCDDLALGYALRNGLEIPENLLLLPLAGRPEGAFDSYRQRHNKAIVLHYGATQRPVGLDNLVGLYGEALAAAPDAEYAAFTARHLATLLLDAGALTTAENVLERHLQLPVSEDARVALQALLCSVWMQTLAVPYDQGLLGKIKDTLWDTLQYYERHGRQAELGLLLIDASEVANLCNSYAESLGYINRAVSILQGEELGELLGSAFLRKGTLLYTWAQNGNPQFYRGALQAFQEALKVYRQATAPDVFADIHHKLGVLYAEMPDDHKKRQLWAALSATSFREALSYYTREVHPYAYAMICNNYANALTKYPAALHADNYEKALDLYGQALEIRTAAHPYERAITLLNYLEAAWQLDAGTDAGNGEGHRQRYEDMVRKASEVKALVTDPALLAEADNHLAQLAELKKVLVPAG